MWRRVRRGCAPVTDVRKGMAAPRRARENRTMGGVLHFAGCVVDLGRYELRRDDQPVHVEPQVFDVLAYLIAHRERLVTKQELLDAVWGTRFVSESALASRIRAARAAIGDD